MNDLSHARRHVYIAVLLAIVYGVGLTRQWREPWIGLHDWNGAFFSQLARNFLRYPFSMHRGMPVVAMGQAVPSAEERCFYPRHPPALVWLVAGAFRIAGESEAVARSVPIACSLGSLLLLIHLVSTGRGRAVAWCAGAIYALMPMSVYFGRMVDHESVCLFCMLAALACWRKLSQPVLPTSARLGLLAAWSASMVVAVWVDWPGALFAAVFLADALLQWRERRVSTGVFLISGLMAVASCLSVLAYLVYLGFDGQWGELFGLFQSRREPISDRSWWAPFRHGVRNLTRPVLVLAVLGLIMALLRRRFAFPAPKAHLNAIPDVTSRPQVRMESSGLGVLSLTGLIWVVVFWRQFQIHEYWMFYLGPAVALYAANALVAAYEFVLRKWRSLALPLAMVLAVVVIVECLRRTNRYFAEMSFPPNEVQAMQRVADMTKPDERIVLTWNPIAVDRHSSFEFRNIVPTQLAYYLDRAFVVANNESEIRRYQQAGAFIVLRGQ